MRKTESIFLDLDGTLVNSERGIVNAAEHLLAQYGLPRESRQALKKFIGPTLRVSLREFYGFEGAALDEAVKVYRSYYGTKGLFECALYPGVPETLDRLKEAGKRVYLATSKVERFARTLLEHFDIADRFDGIAGSDDAGLLDNKEKVLQALKERLELPDFSDAVMVGDGTGDMRAARRLGLYAVGAAYGFSTREQLLDAGAETLIDSFPQLWERL